MMVKVIRMYILDNPKGATRAFADVLFHDNITVKGCKIIEGQNGLFASLPTQKSQKDDKWYPTVTIKDDQMYEYFKDLLIGYYNNGGKEYKPQESSSQKQPPKTGGDEAPLDDVPF